MLNCLVNYQFLPYTVHVYTFYKSRKLSTRLVKTHFDVTEIDFHVEFDVNFEIRPLCFLFICGIDFNYS